MINLSVSQNIFSYRNVLDILCANFYDKYFCTILNRSVESRKRWHMQDLIGKTFTFSSLSIIFIVAFFDNIEEKFLTILKKFPLTPILLRVFIIKLLDLAKNFLSIYRYDHMIFCYFFYYFYIIRCIMLNDLFLLNHPCIPGRILLSHGIWTT